MTTATYIPTERAKSLRRFINAHRLWHRKCDALNAAERNTGMNSPETAAALSAWEKGRMPSKRSKYHAYDDARALADYIEAKTGLRPPRAGTVNDLEDTMTVFNRLVR
jgi:hypothetical protein